MTQALLNSLHSRQFSRIGKALIVVLLGVVNLAAFAHFAFVAHERCPEHGDWVHVRASAARSVAARKSPRTDFKTAAWHDLDVDTGHDHCSAPTVLRNRLVQQTPVVASHAARAQVSPPPPQFPPAPIALQVATLHAAPKTSPPA